MRNEWPGIQLAWILRWKVACGGKTGGSAEHGGEGSPLAEDLGVGLGGRAWDGPRAGRRYLLGQVTSGAAALDLWVRGGSSCHLLRRGVRVRGACRARGDVWVAFFCSAQMSRAE